MTWQPVVTPLFHRRKKKASSPLQEAIDGAVRAILADPLIDELKVGTLQGVRVYKFTHHGLKISGGHSKRSRGAGHGRVGEAYGGIPE